MSNFILSVRWLKFGLAVYCLTEFQLTQLWLIFGLNRIFHQKVNAFLFMHLFPCTNYQLSTVLLYSEQFADSSNY